MALTPYCEFAEVRAALGVNAVELPDAVLALPIYAMGLLRELNKVDASLPASFLAVSNIDVGVRTATQTALYEATRLFSCYACAKQVGVSLASILPKDVGDGKATISRFADAPYKETLARVDAMYSSAKASLAATLAGIAQTTIEARSPNIFVAGSRVYDPVTG